MAHAISDAVLPRGSLVRITGNNRTKNDLVGREGFVQAAQTLGGWHEVQLDDGSTVRVQRNALRVMNTPNPHVLQYANPPPQIAPALYVQQHRPVSIPIQKVVKRKVKKDSDRRIHANIAKLNVTSLKKYGRYFQLKIAKDCSRDELVGAVRKHFATTKVDEAEVISSFLRHIARGGSAAND